MTNRYGSVLQRNKAWLEKRKQIIKRAGNTALTGIQPPYHIERFSPSKKD